MLLVAALFFKRTLLVTIAICSCLIVSSQKTLTHSVHKGKTTKESLSNTSSSPAVLANMFTAIRNASTNIERADIYYWISRNYADRLKIDSALFYMEKIKEESAKANYEVGLGKYYLAGAYVNYLKGKPDTEGYKKAAEIFTRHRDDLFSGIAYRQLARQHGPADYRSSRINSHIGINFLSTANNPGELQRAYYELGRSFFETFEMDSSALYLITALKLAEKINDPGRIFNASGILGELYLVADNLDESAKYFKYALDSRTAKTSKVEVRVRLGNYAACLMLKGEFEKASSILKEYELINEKLGDNWGLINLYRLKGIYNYESGNYPEALKYMKLAYNRSGEIINYSSDVKNIFFYLAKAEYKMGMYDSALSRLPYVTKISTQLHQNIDLLEVNLLTSQCYEKKGMADSAYYYFVTYAHLKDSLLSIEKEKAVLDLTTRYETEKKEQQIKILETSKEAGDYALALQNQQLEKQSLENEKKSQQLLLLSQQSAISKLEAYKQSLTLQNQQKDILKKQQELKLMSKENRLRETIAIKENLQKRIAYIAVFAVLLLAGISIYRYRQIRKLGKSLAASLVSLKEAQDQLVKTEKEKEAENLRLRISRDIHDEVGATLSGVALFSEIAKQKMEQHQDEEAQVYLNHISTNSKEMVEKISDIVWAINPENDSFDRIISKLKVFAFNLCAGKGIELHLHVDDSMQNLYPPMHIKRNLYLFMKEAINNAIKYSGAKNIYFSLRLMEEQIIACINDDGKGFNNSVSYQGNGLKNMKARAMNLDAKFDIDSASGEGTKISLQFPFHPIGGQQRAV
ncbi:MAG: histidine kinase [Ferruginibacter sp.]